MKNTTMLILFLIIVIIGIFFLTLNSGAKTLPQNTNEVVNSTINGEVQQITLSMKRGNYYPREIRVKEGIPVVITLDKTVSGCFRAFTLREFNVNKYSRNPSQTINFIPNKNGVFTFSCSMNMASGKIIVE